MHQKGHFRKVAEEYFLISGKKSWDEQKRSFLAFKSTKFEKEYKIRIKNHAILLPQLKVLDTFNTSIGHNPESEKLPEKLKLYPKSCRNN